LLRVRLGIDRPPDGLWHRLGRHRVPEIEKRMAEHLRVLEHAVEDLQFRDALARVVLNPAELLERIGRVARRHPTVAVAQDADEERPALVDLLEAELEDLVVLGLLAGDAPTQVDVDQADAVLLQPFAQGREDHLDEVIALRVHVTERRRDEDTDGFPGTAHANPRVKAAWLVLLS